MPILALLTAFGPILAQLIPQLGKILNPAPTEVASRNLQTAELVLNTITSAAGATNVQDAVQKLQASPELVQTVTKAVVTDDKIMPFLTVMDNTGVPAAREAEKQMASSDVPFYKLPVFNMTVLLLPLVYFTVVWVLIDKSGVSTDTKSMVIGVIMGTVLGSIVTYYYGTTQQSAKKDETIANSLPDAKV